MNVVIRPMDYFAKLNGTGNLLWEPLWKVYTQLSPLEKKILELPQLRRLHYIHQVGLSYINTPLSATRLQHTIGVFSIAAHFFPQWKTLRVAALLHDIGHFPFSHALEPLGSINHHCLTKELIRFSEISDLLKEHSVDVIEVISIIDGESESPLRNNSRKLNLDHLDSWVRNAHASGILSIAPKKILENFSFNKSEILVTSAIANILVELMISEAEFHCSTTNIAINAMLKNLVSILISNKFISFDNLVKMTDQDLIGLLMSSTKTSNEFEKLLYNFGDLVVLRDSIGLPSHAIKTSVNKVYLSELEIIDGNLDQNSIRQIERIKSFVGDYYVFRSHEKGV